MLEELNNFRTTVDYALADRRVLLSQLETQQEAYNSFELELTVREEAHAIIQEAAKTAQQSIEHQLGSIVTMALASIFPDPYDFKMEFVSKRNTTECEFYFVKNGNKIPPLNDTGFGPVDIASIAMKISYREISNTRPILFLDEPCKNLSNDYKAVAAEVFRGLCERLGLQMIVITHIPEFREAADRLFMVKQNSDGISKLTVR